MMRLSTREAAKKLRIDHSTLANYIAIGKAPSPEAITVGRRVVHMWTEEQVEHLRKLLPKIANGRKTRYQKLRKNQQASTGVPVPHKKRRTKKKK